MGVDGSNAVKWTPKRPKFDHPNALHSIGNAFANDLVPSISHSIFPNFFSMLFLLSHISIFKGRAGL